MNVDLISHEKIIIVCAYFLQHGKKSTTMWVRPLEPIVDGEASGSASEEGAAAKAERPHHPSVMEIQRKLEAMFPEFNELSTRSDKGFQPHLSLGQFKPNAVEKWKDQFKAGWTDIEFEVKEIYLISRADFDDPFHVRHAVKLGTDLTE